MNIVCKDCLGKNTLKSINHERKAKNEAKADNDRITQLLKQSNIDELAGGGLPDSKVEKEYVQALRNNHDIINRWPATKKDIIDDFERLYGEWDVGYWTVKQMQDDYALPEGVPAVPHFVSDDNQNFFFALNPHLTMDRWTIEDRLMLRRVTGLNRLEENLFSKSTGST